MAMTKQQQREAAQRILAAHPMTEEDLATERSLLTDPDNYPKNRVCLMCGRIFDRNDIEGHVTHLATHSPTAAQWVEAHKRIEAGKDLAKAKERQSLSV